MNYFNLKALRKILIGINLLIGLTAIYGGYELVRSNGMGMPLSWLSEAPFHTYTIPGILLMLVTGGTCLTTAYLLFTNKKYALEMSFITGCGILIWTFSELYIILHTNFLQIVYFGLGILIVSTTAKLLKTKEG